MASRTEAETNRCPRCGALPGESCFRARPRFDGQIRRVSTHQERHTLIARLKGKRVGSRNSLVPPPGWPNALQARQLIADKMDERGGYDSFADELGISNRYLRLVLCGERAPVHEAFLKYFGWPAVYEVAPEDDL